MEVIGFWDWFALVVFSGINFFIYRGLSSYARPTLGENGEIVSPGTDLHSKGLVEYHWDILYITWFVQITSLYSKWFWLVMLVIPAFAIFKLWGVVIKPWLAAAAQAEQTETPADKKRREKMERKMNRTKYKVVRK